MNKTNAPLRLILSLTALLLALPAAQAQFTFTTNNGAITITQYTGRGTNVTVPDWTNGYPVTSLAAQAFASCAALTNITIGTNVTSIKMPVAYACPLLAAFTVNTNNPAYSSVAGVLFDKQQTTLIEFPLAKASSYTIPNSVTNIGMAAFESCGLTNVAIPNSVTIIGDTAFFACNSLTNVTIGTGVTSIGSRAFWCSRLPAITVDANNPAYSSGAGVLFNKSQTTLIQCPEGKAGSYTIPNSVLSIGYWAFEGCAGLTNVIIPNSVTNIGMEAFENCIGLTNVIMPDSVTSIGYWAFMDCTRLANVIIPNSVTNIGEEAFMDCASLTSVTIPNSVTSLGEEAFKGCADLTNVIIPNSVTSIAGAAFEGCARLSSVIIPGSVTSIAGGAFEGCTSLTNVIMPNSVTNIGEDAFYGCTSLVSVTLPGSVTSLADYAFYDCPGLSAVCFLGNAPSLGSSVFDGDTNATVYYLTGTTGWGTTFGGLPTAPGSPPALVSQPPSQTVEAGSTASFRVGAVGQPAPVCQWCFNTDSVTCATTNCLLVLTNVQSSQAGTYYVIVTNSFGAVTSAPVLLNVIAPVVRQSVPGVMLTGHPGSTLNLDAADGLAPAAGWTTVYRVMLTDATAWYFDLSSPLPGQRFFRGRQISPPDAPPALVVHLVPALALTGAVGSTVRIDGINQSGPTDAWFPLATVTLTNTSQFYFDVSAIGQPPRLWRIVPGA